MFKEVKKVCFTVCCLKDESDCVLEEVLCLLCPDCLLVVDFGQCLLFLCPVGYLLPFVMFFVVFRCVVLCAVWRVQFFIHLTSFLVVPPVCKRSDG